MAVIICWRKLATHGLRYKVLVYGVVLKGCYKRNVVTALLSSAVRNRKDNAVKVFTAIANRASGGTGDDLWIVTESAASPSPEDELADIRMRRYREHLIPASSEQARKLGELYAACPFALAFGAGQVTTVAQKGDL